MSVTEQRLTIELFDQWRTDSLFIDSCDIDLYYYLFPFPIIAILIYYSGDRRKKQFIKSMNVIKMKYLKLNVFCCFRLFTQNNNRYNFILL